MIRPTDIDPVDRDESLGEAIEHYLALAETGPPPDPEAFVTSYPELGDELREALEGLALVRGLVGEPGRPPGGTKLESGRHLAGYRIVHELGRGGMGVVYEAVHVGLDRPVALKVLGLHAAPDSTSRRRFLNEARTAAGLHHTHIVPVFDVGQVGGLCYYAMQRIEGSGLDRVLRALRRERATAAGSGTGKTPPVPALPGPDSGTWIVSREDAGRSRLGPSRSDRDREGPPFVPPRGSAYFRWVANVGLQAAEALAHAHQRGIVHRDIKPSNLLVDATGSVWVADFGLARRLEDPGLTRSDSLLGTPRYMSPEQAESRAIDGRTDIYSLGATLYELLTLRPPFEGQTAAELTRQIVGREPVAPRREDRRIARDLETIVLKAMAKRPADRYATAADLAADLERFLNLEPVRARRISPLGRAWRLARRHPVPAVVSTVATAVILATATVAYIRVRQERDLALDAQKLTQTALAAKEEANRQTRAALIESKWREASLLRKSPGLDRREKGLRLVKNAAALGPAPPLRAALRAEAIEFLVLRDVEDCPPLPAGTVRALAFGPQADRLATLSQDGQQLVFWDVGRRERLAKVPVDVGSGRDEGRPPGPPGIRGLRLAALGPEIAVAGPGRSLHLFDAVLGNPIGDLVLGPAGSETVSLFASPTGHRLVTVDRLDGARPHPPEYQIHLWDPETTDQPLATLEGPRLPARGGNAPPPLVAIAPDGETIATSYWEDGQVRLWGPDGRDRGKIEVPSRTTALALGPDGVLAVAGDGVVRLWQTASQTPLPSLTPRLGIIHLLRFSPDGTLLALAGPGPGLELWDVSVSAPVAALPEVDRVHDLTFSPDGHLLAVGAEGQVQLWEIAEPVGRVRLPEAPGEIRALDFGPDGWLAVASEPGLLRTWQAGRCPTSIHEHAGIRASAATFDPHGRLLALDRDQLVRLASPDPWAGIEGKDLPADPERFPLPIPLRGRWANFSILTQSCNRERLILAARNGELLLGRAEDPNSFRPLILTPGDSGPGGPQRPRWRSWWREVALAPTGDRLYLLGARDEFSAWSLADSTPRLLPWEPFEGTTELALSPDGSTLALGDRSGGISLIDTAQGTLRNRIPPPAGEPAERVSALAFAPDGLSLAVGTREQIRLYQVGPTPRILTRLPSHRGAVIQLAFDPTGQHLASAGDDLVVEVWDLARIRRDLARLDLDW